MCLMALESSSVSTKYFCHNAPPLDIYTPNSGDDKGVIALQFPNSIPKCIEFGYTTFYLLYY